MYNWFTCKMTFNRQGEDGLIRNGSGIAEGRDLKDKSFNVAQMPNRSTKD